MDKQETTEHSSAQEAAQEKDRYGNPFQHRMPKRDASEEIAPIPAPTQAPELVKLTKQLHEEVEAAMAHQLAQARANEAAAELRIPLIKLVRHVGGVARILVPRLEASAQGPEQTRRFVLAIDLGMVAGLTLMLILLNWFK